MILRLFDIVKRFITSKEIRFSYLTKLGFFNSWSDEKFLRKKYRIVTGEELDLDNPRTFNEKLQWQKIYDRKPLYTTLVDKYAVKEWVKGKIGNEYVIETYGVWENFDDIDFSKLPEKFVLKTTHDSGGVIICKDKSTFDRRAARRFINNSMKLNYYYAGREWPYKDVPHRIIAEKYLVDESGVELKDYKFFCFNGVPKLIQVDFGRFTVHKRNLYTPAWEYVDAQIKFPKDPTTQIPRPVRLDRMLEIASILSEGIPQVRVDLYSIGNDIFFGEMTMTHGGGMEKFTPKSLEFQMGEWIRIE